MSQQFDIVGNLLLKVDGAEAGLNKLKNSLSKLEIPKGLDNNLKKSFSNLDGIFERFRNQLSKGFETKTDVSNITKVGKELDSELNRMSKTISQLTGEKIDLKVDTEKVKQATKDLELALEKKKELTQQTIDIKVNSSKEGITNIKQLLEEFQRVIGDTKAGTAVGNALFHLDSGDIQKTLSFLKEAEANLGRIGEKKKEAFSSTGFTFESALELVIKELTTAEGQFNIVNGEVKDFQSALSNARGDQLRQVNDILSKVSQGFDQTAAGARQAAKAGEEFGRATYDAAEQVKQLQQSTQYFFSLRNMINLLKRGVREAVDTIKELDAAMTKTAVVTNFSVGDMWAKLPEYTANANALGATVKDMYESTTLYYQQGLNAQQAMSIATETMKMARIGGLEAAEATDMMTAALRGFNMELNETSAERINDVYSNLAAKTASNTEELGTAMQRTASIAASAGMSFEGTAAFLAQAIETTREPAENLGTAMKTIVARFTELKKNPLEITEVDGEEVSYNKIDTALQSIGVSLKDANGQFRDLDDVFLDISRKWDGLTQTQQRYIATTAAGSRQQSRFIAMMSNYDRTVQLMDYANNANGASSAQFAKTLESLEAKLNKFQNAWKQFLMGIMNDSWTKGIVDGATKVLNTVNKLIDTLSFGSKGIKSALSVFTAFTGLKMAGRGANMLIGGLGGMVDPKSSIKNGLATGFLGGQASKISNPIVQAINGLIPHIDGKVTEGSYKYQNYGNYKNARAQLGEQVGQFSDIKDLGKLYSNKQYSFSGFQSIVDQNQLNEQQQKALLNSFPGLKKNMANALANLLKDSAATPEVAKGLIAGFKSGNITTESVLEQAGLLTDISGKMAQMGEEEAETFIQSERKAIASQHHEKIMSEIAEKGIGKDDFKQYYNSRVDELLKQKRYATSGEAQEVLDLMRDLSPAEKAANTLNGIGAGLTSAGMSLQMFGNQLSTVNPMLGDMVTKLGGLLTTAGSIPNMVASLVAGGPAVIALTAAVAALGGAFLYFQNQSKKIKNAAEEISKSFEETNKTTTQNIADLKSYRDELAALSKGVDSSGNNISLSDDEYSRYLEIVDNIAEINPAIVEGYNAQGHAIINNNKALEETLKLQQDIQDKALKDYTSTDSLQKLINARNINKDYKQSAYTTVNGTVWRENGEVSGLSGVQVKAAPMTDAVKQVAKELQNADWFDESQLEAFGIHSLDALINGEEQAVNAFVRNQDKINSQLGSVALLAGDTFSDKLTESFATLGEKTGLFEEAIEPIYQNLATQVSNMPIFDSIPDELKQYAMSGLKEIASQDWGAEKMIDEAKELATYFSNLTEGSTEYTDALDIVAEAQETFADTLDETQYETDVQPAIDELYRLKEEALNSGSVYGNALAEYLENQIQRIASFTSAGGATIQEGLNTATSAIAEAEGALDQFNENTKKDFWTAAEGMKDIYDKIFETYKDSYGNELQKHTEGEGDTTFWTGAEALLSPDKLEGGVKTVSKTLKDLEPWLREGKEGMDAFFMDVVNNPNLKKLQEEGLIKLDERGWFEKIPEGQWENVANALGISEELLTSMLNKARQFGLISFDNLDKVREALATSDASIAGTKTNATGQKELYVKEDTMRANLREAGYNTTESQDKVIAQLLEEQNVHMVQTMDKLTKDSAKSLVDAWGVKDLPDLITKMTETGEYNKEEILDLAEKAGYGTAEETAGLYDNIVRALENPELAEQTSELQSINAKLDAITDHVLQKTIDEHEVQQEAAHESSLGENGIATQFAKGLDAEGKVLDTGSFAVVRKELEDTQQQYKETADYYRERAKLANEDDAKRFNKLADLYDKDADAIKKAIKQGEDAKKKLKDQAEDRKGKNKHKRDDNGNKTQPPEPTPAQPLPKKEAKQVVEIAQEKGKNRDTEHYKAIMDLEEGPGFGKTEKKLSKWEEDSLDIDADINVKGEEDVEEAEKSVISLQELVNSPFAMTINSNYLEVLKAQGIIGEVKETADGGAFITVGSNYSQVISARQELFKIAGKAFTSSLSIGTGGAINTLTSIWNLIQKIIKNKSKATSFRGQGGGHEKEGAAIGKHNHGYASIPTFGSAAKGGYGRVGPKGKGGLTLTGELGYEIAWLPNENRSMILGANGPQMIDLPGNAVVWTHEQSKKMLKQKAIPAGSHVNPSAKGNSINYVVTYPAYQSVSGTYYTKSKNTNNNSTSKTEEKSSKKRLKTVKQMDYWWEKINRQIKTADNIGDKLGKQTDKILKDLRASVEQVEDINQNFVKVQKDIIDLNEAVSKNSEKKLNKLSKGGKNDKYIAANDKYEKAKAAYEKKKTDKNKKAVQNAKKNLKKVAPKGAIKARETLDKAEAAYEKNKNAKNKKALTKAKKTYNKFIKKGSNWQYVDWTTQKTSGKKTESVDHHEKINLSDYIKKDANGTYYVNEKAINKIKGKAKKQAVSEKAYEEIDKWQGRRDDANDKIEKAQDEIANYRKEIDNTFFGWKNELTEIYRITGQIEKAEAKINKSKSLYDYNKALLDREDLSKGLTTNAKAALNQMKKSNRESIATTKAKREAKQELLDKGKTKGQIHKEQALYGDVTSKKVTYETINGKPKTESEKKIYNRIKKLKGAKRGSGQSWDELSDQEKQIYARGRAFSSGYITGNEKTGYSFDVEKIKNDKASGKISEELYNLIKETYDTLHDYDVQYLDTEAEIINLQAEEAELQKEYQDTVDSIAEQLYGWKNTLTKILELSTKIEQTEKRTSLLKNAQDYYTAKSKAGIKGADVSSKEILSVSIGQVASAITAIQDREKLIGEKRQEILDYLSGNDLSDEIKKFEEQLVKDPTDDKLKSGLKSLTDEVNLRNDARKYITTTANPDGTFSIEFNSQQLELDKLADGGKLGTEYYKKIENYAQELINKNNELAEAMAAQVSSVIELYTQLADLKQTYADSAKELREAYSAQQQKVIDNLKTLYSAIDNAFKDLINQVKQDLQNRRKQEDNKKIEQDISKKQQRLAALRANTASGNQVAIAQLEKEIADAQQSYGRTLEDQLLDQLSQQNDEAAKQRQEQIDLLQAQRDIAQKTGVDATLINEWLHDPNAHRTEIEQALRQTEGWSAMTKPEREVADTTLANRFLGYETLPEQIALTEQAINLAKDSIAHTETIIHKSTIAAIATATKTVSDGLTSGLTAVSTELGTIGKALGQELTNTKDAIAKIERETAKAIANLQKQIGVFNELEEAKAEKADTEKKLKNAQDNLTAKQKAFKTADDNVAAALKRRNQAYDNFEAAQGKLQYYNKLIDDLGWQIQNTTNQRRRNQLISQRATAIKNQNDAQKEVTAAQKEIDASEKNYNQAIQTFEKAQEELMKAQNTVVNLTDDLGKITKTVQNLETQLSTLKFASGGLNTHTGPAWLDGSPSKPELVLNAADTQNFLALRDVLSKAIGSANSIENSYGGDATYEININVDKLTSDYDVDKVAERVKKIIVKDSSYRNVTQVRNLR